MWLKDRARAQSNDCVCGHDSCPGPRPPLARLFIHFSRFTVGSMINAASCKSISFSRCHSPPPPPPSAAQPKSGETRFHSGTGCQSNHCSLRDENALLCTLYLKFNIGNKIINKLVDWVPCRKRKQTFAPFDPLRGCA